MENITIIGGGVAAAALVSELATLHYAGPVIWIMEENTLPYDRTFLSKVMLSEPSAELPLLITQQKLNTLDITLYKGVKVQTIDRQKRVAELDNGTKVNYGKLVIATGGRPRKMDAADDIAHYLRTSADAAVLKAKLDTAKSVAIIGGGWIGLEVAAAAASLGLKVTLIEREGAIAARVLPNDISRWLESLHRHHGVEVIHGAVVEDTALISGVAMIKLTDGRVLEAGLLVAGIGMLPNDELAKAAGINTDTGILTDEEGATSDPHIYAIGDAAKSRVERYDRHLRLESWENAQWQGTRLAKKLTGEPVPALPVPWFWSDQYGYNIQLLGIKYEGTPIIRAYANDEWIRCYCTPSGVVTAAIAVNRGKDMRTIRRMIDSAVPIDKALLANTQYSLQHIFTTSTEKVYADKK
jgi:3-phenylpropionate/trans-cinnamate dioxygenase ferredoxin reductase subunit